MELHQAIVNMEKGGSADGILQVNFIQLPTVFIGEFMLNCLILMLCGFVQVRADRIQSDLEELLKALTERCKKHGVDVKSSALIELPFGTYISFLHVLYKIYINASSPRSTQLMAFKFIQYLLAILLDRPCEETTFVINLLKS